MNGYVCRLRAERGCKKVESIPGNLDSKILINIKFYNGSQLKLARHLGVIPSLKGGSLFNLVSQRLMLGWGQSGAFP